MTRLLELAECLGQSPGQASVLALLERIVSDQLPELPAPEIKAYSDVVYHNYRSLGLSVQYEPASAAKEASKCGAQDLRLAAIDIYSARDDRTWTCFPALPIEVKPASPEKGTSKASITLNSTGKDLVSAFGEPHRKGGGAGGRAGPAAWMEWTIRLEPCPTLPHSEPAPVKIQIELSGAGARGLDRWNADRAGSCHWAVINISRQ